MPKCVSYFPFSCGTLQKSKNWFDVLNFGFSHIHGYSGSTVIRDSRVGEVSFRLLALGELGKVSFRLSELGELGEASFRILELGELGETSFRMLELDAANFGILY